MGRTSVLHPSYAVRAFLLSLFTAVLVLMACTTPATTLPAVTATATPTEDTLPTSIAGTIDAAVAGTEAARPPATDVPGGRFVGVYLTRLSNLVIGSGQPFPFTEVRKASPGYFDINRPTDVTIPVSGWYWVGYEITTLGTGYGGATNRNLVIAVLKNYDGQGPILDFMVVGRRFSHSNGKDAYLDSQTVPCYLEAGDTLQLVIQNHDASSVLVESNPSDGLPNGFLNDDGPGTLSPHFYVILMPGH